MTGGSDRGSYFIPKKIPTSEVVYPKKLLLFLAHPKKSLSLFASANFIIYLLESENMPTSTLVLVKNKTIQKQIQKARMTVIVSLHPIFCDNFIFLSGLDARGVPVITFHIDYNLRNIS